MRGPLVFGLVVALSGVTWDISATPPSPPASVTISTIPAAIHVGEVATTVITLSPSMDLDRLEVSVRPLDGLKLLSKTKQAVFTDVKKTEDHVLTVTVRLIGKRGTLAVYYTTEVRGRRLSGAGGVTYGDLN